MTTTQCTGNLDSIEEGTKQLQQLGCSKIHIFIKEGTVNINVRKPFTRRMWDSGVTLQEAFRKIIIRVATTE